MNTSKPISSITWCSPSFLFDRLCELERAKKISYFCYICHRGEKGDKESGGKDHIHLYIEPAKRLQTLELRDYLTQIDMTNGKPIKPLDFRNSNFSDWYMYCLHDASYLATKNQRREYTYTPSEFKYNDEREFEYRVAHVDISDSVPISKLKTLAKAGLTFEDMVNNGHVPIQQINYWRMAYDCVMHTAGKVEKTPTTNNDDDSLDTYPVDSPPPYVPTMYVPQDLPFEGEIRILNPGQGVWPKLPQ